MVPVKEPAGLGFKIFAVLGVVFFLVVVAALVRTYDRDVQVAAGGPVVTASAPSSPSVGTASQAPVGAVATGGGGMAGDGPGIMVPVFVGLVALTMLATAGIVLRRQEA